MVEDIPPPEAFDAPADEPDRPPPRFGRLRRALRTGLILLVVASMVGFAAIQGHAVVVRGDLPIGPFGNARLVVVDEAGALIAMHADGGFPVSFAAQGMPFEFPTWSPDGTRIAAIGHEDGVPGLYVQSPGTGDAASPPPRLVYASDSNPPFYAYWTPDGRALTFLTTETETLALRFVPADGSAPARVLRMGAPMYWTFADAGRLYVHSGDVGDDVFLGEIDLDGQPIAGTEAVPGPFRAPAVSRDGRFRALVRDEGALVRLAIEARDGSGSTAVDVLGPTAFAFSPRSDDLAFIGPERSGDTAGLPIGPLQLIGRGDGAPRTVMPGRVVAFFWAPSGTTIATLRVAEPNNPVTEAVARPASAQAQPAVAGVPIRLSMVDVASGAIRADRVVRLSELFVNQVLPFFDQYALSHRFWSPDGSAFALPAVDNDGVTQVVAFPADGSDARVVATGRIGFWRP